MKQTIKHKHLVILVTLLMLSTLILGGNNALSTRANQSTPPLTACSNATLNGQYRYMFNGAGFPGGSRGGAPVNAAGNQFAAVGLITFNGDGTHSGSDTFSLSGGNIIESRQYNGTYAVGANCRGTFCLQTGPSGECFGPADIVVAPDGSEMLFINTIQHTAVLGQFRKQ